MQKTHKIYYLLLSFFLISSLAFLFASIQIWDDEFFSNETLSLTLILLAIQLYAINRFHYISFQKAYYHINFSFIIALLGGFKLFIFYLGIITLTKYHKHNELQENKFFLKMSIEFLSMLTAGSLIHLLSLNYIQMDNIFQIDTLSILATLVIIFNLISNIPTILIEHFDKRLSFKDSQNAFITANVQSFATYFLYFSILLGAFFAYGLMGAIFVSISLYLTEYYIEQNYLIKMQSITDPLTSVYNRGYLDRMLQQYQNENRRFSVIMMDIDNFKHINETYNHLVGDMVLKEFAKVIQDSLRTNDIIVRYGGEEFVVILENVTLDNTFMISERIRRNIEKKVYLCPYQNEVYTIQHTSSVGIGVYNNRHPNNVIEEADNNLKIAKHTGKNKVHYHEIDKLKQWYEDNVK